MWSRKINLEERAKLISQVQGEEKHKKNKNNEGDEQKLLDLKSKEKGNEVIGQKLNMKRDKHMKIKCTEDRDNCSDVQSSNESDEEIDNDDEEEVDFLGFEHVLIRARSTRIRKASHATSAPYTDEFGSGERNTNNDSSQQEDSQPHFHLLSQKKPKKK